MSKIVGDEACPRCREKGGDKTGNHLIIFEDGNRYCPKCEYFESNGEPPDEDEEPPIEVKKGKVDPLNLDSLAIPSRGLAANWVGFYNHRCSVDPTNGEVDKVYYPRYSQGQHVGWKCKEYKDKKFFSIGQGKDIDLAGMEIEGGTRLVIITEGEDDMVAAKSMLADVGKDYRVVSLPNGANTALTKYSHEWLSTFENILLAFDMDEPGQEAAKAFSEMFDAGKVKVASLPHKDANDCLLEGDGAGFYHAIRRARVLSADGIVRGEDTWDDFKEALEQKDGGLPYPWEDLNEKVYGMRLGELDTFTSGTGMGKTQLLREIQYHIAITEGQTLGVMSLEEPLEDAVLGQMTVHASVPLHLPDVRGTLSEEQLYEHWEATYGTGNYVLYDHFGSLQQDALTSKIRYLAAGMGCTHIILDHLSIVVSEYASDGDERKIIDEIMSKLKRLTQELGIWIGLVVHLRKSSGVPFELGGVPSLDDLRGSGAIKQLSNQVIAISRNQQEEDPILRNTSAIHVLKSRFTGRTGPAGLLYYDEMTGRMYPSTLSWNDYHQGIAREVPRV